MELSLFAPTFHNDQRVNSSDTQTFFLFSLRWSQYSEMKHFKIFVTHLFYRNLVSVCNSPLCPAGVSTNYRNLLGFFFLLSLAVLPPSFLHVMSHDSCSNAAHYHLLFHRGFSPETYLLKTEWKWRTFWVMMSQQYSFAHIDFAAFSLCYCILFQVGILDYCHRLTASPSRSCSVESACGCEKLG